MIFSKPGLYFYYCANHSHVDAETYRAEAFKLASEYPIPMEGFIQHRYRRDESTDHKREPDLHALQPGMVARFFHHP